MLETCSTSHHPRSFTARLKSRTDSTPIARHLLRAYLSCLSEGDRYGDVAELLLNELFANAVQHSDAPDDRHIEVRFDLVGGLLRIEVHDAGTGRPTLRPSKPDDERGRGMFLINALSERWGCCPRAGGIGKFVWALVAPIS
ncbi:ATP-binding protein [Kitasatospora sp. NPDC101183]|uniref:ATP-binding protein n=1 Tax=Kitasatospora sp. NPDC101183 TaxID=3364100 RepID=UPI0038250544